MTTIERVAALALGVALASCEPCTRDCSEYQRVIFVDGSGAALTPLALTDGNIVHRCSDTRTVACEGNELTYLLTDDTPHSIRAEATTGEVFEGEITR